MKTPEGDAVSLGHDDIGEPRGPLPHIIPSKSGDPMKSPIGCQKRQKLNALIFLQSMLVYYSL